MVSNWFDHKSAPQKDAAFAAIAILGDNETFMGDSIVMDSASLKIIPLGGLGEIGKNMMAFEYGGDVLIVDAGIMFPDNAMPGIDYIIPDFNYLLTQPGLTVRGIIITHGHEDHTGAIAHVAAALPAPIYGTPMTCGLLEGKLRSGKLIDKVPLNRFRAGDTLELGPFKVETFHVCHSIPDCVGLGIHTPVGLVVHTGDFKIDQTPIDNWPTDYARLASFAQKGVLLLLSDSTNADRPGWTPSERVIDAAFDRVFRAAPGRIIVATFASLISRIQQVADAAVRHGRKLAISGNSMSDNIRMATNLGYLMLPDSLVVGMDDALKLPANQIVFMATGTQGEPSAALHRLAIGKHRQFAIQPGDTVILSSHPIPGNEEAVYRTINNLFRKGANVIYDPLEQVHVSGHASQEEQKLMISLVRPRYFVPVHGELRHLKQHARLAESVGIAPENIAVIENGMILELDATGKMSIGARMPGGYVFVDGSSVGEITFPMLRSRSALAREGFVTVSVVIDRATNAVMGVPQIASESLTQRPDAETLIAHLRETVYRVVAESATANGTRQDLIQEAVSRLIRNETRHRPRVFALITEI